MDISLSTRAQITSFRNHSSRDNDVLWIEHFDGLAEDGGGGRRRSSWSQDELEQLFSRQSEPKCGQNGCSFHQEPGCHSCGSVLRLLLIQDNGFSENNQVTWTTRMAKKGYLEEVSKEALEYFRHLRKNDRTIIRPQYGQQTALCFAWATIVPSNEPFAEVYTMKALIIQSSPDIVVEILKERCIVSIPHLVHRPNLALNARSNLLTRLTDYRARGSDIKDLKHATIEALCRLILDEESLVLTEVGFFLIDIEKKLVSMGKSLRKMEKWRLQIGLWRAYLHNMNGWCTRYAYNIDQLQIVEQLTSRSSGDDSWASRQQRQQQQQLRPDPFDILKKDIHGFQARIKIVLDHTEATSSTLIGTISILQAEDTRRLTILAGIFVPMTVVAGIFGMNTKFFIDEPGWHLALIAALVVSIASYVTYTLIGRWCAFKRNKVWEYEEAV